MKMEATRKAWLIKAGSLSGIYTVHTKIYKI